MMILQEDPRTGVALGVRVYPMATDDAALVPLYRDADGGRYYGVALERADKAKLPDLRDVLQQAATPAADLEPAAKNEAASGLSGRGPPAWLALPVILGIILAVFGSVGWFARRSRKRNGASP